MSKKKTSSAARKPTPTATKGGPGNRGSSPSKGRGGATWLIVGAIVVLALVAIVSLSSRNAAKPGGASAAATGPDEASYIGRLLPAGYEEPKIADPYAYTTAIKMTDITPAVDGANVSIPVSELATKRNVFFEYKTAAGQTVPMMAYVKGSGKLFVGVSFCLPCKGTGQRIESDGTLTCETCNTKRNLENMAGISGACKRYPLDELPVKVSGGKVVIAKTAIEGWTPQPMDRPIG